VIRETVIVLISYGVMSIGIEGDAAGSAFRRCGSLLKRRDDGAVECGDVRRHAAGDEVAVNHDLLI
jgi:hypothetical protein